MPTRLPQLLKTMTARNHWTPRAWLRSPTFLLVLAGLILPNILTLATLGSFVDVSLPPRTMCIVAYAVLAICARRIPFALTAILFLGIFAFDLVWTLSVSFGLRPHDLLTAVDYAQHIHVFESPLYGALIAVLAATTSATLYLLYRREKLVHGNIVALFAASLVFAGIDYFANVSPHYEFGAMLGRNVPVESAANKSGFNKVAGGDGRNAILVMVEGLGYLNDPAARHQIDAPLFDPRIAGKYQVSTGSIVYYGSTTSGEMRELCDTREPYLEFTRINGYSCLPERLRMRGYATMAVHGFYHSVFERNEWYPIIGFDKEVFVESLVKETH